MDAKLIEEMSVIADEFGTIASKVNESSIQRKKHAENALPLIKKVSEIGKILAKEFETVTRANEKQRIQNNAVLLSCRTLRINAVRQLQLLEQLNSEKSINEKVLEKLNQLISGLSNAVDDLIENSEAIGKHDDMIALFDSKLSLLKTIQLKSLSVLNELTQLGFEEAEKAIQGSASNLERGFAMVEGLKKVNGLAEAGRIDDIDALISEANHGAQIAETVHENSRTQLEFAQKVRDYTERLHQESIAVRNLVKDKHSLFEETLQVVTVVTVGIAVKLKKYLAINELFDQIEFNERNSETFRELDIFANIAKNDITKMISLNYDMTDNSHINNENETKTVELTDRELEFFSSINTEIYKMTEATGFPIEGSSKNIANGRKLAEILKEILASAAQV